MLKIENILDISVWRVKETCLIFKKNIIKNLSQECKNNKDLIIMKSGKCRSIKKVMDDNIALNICIVYICTVLHLTSFFFFFKYLYLQGF